MVRWQLMSPLLTIVSTLFQHAIRLGFWSPQGLLDGAGRHGAREDPQANVALYNFSSSALQRLFRFCSVLYGCHYIRLTGLGCPLHKPKFQNYHVFGHSEERDEVVVSEFS